MADWPQPPDPMIVEETVWSMEEVLRMANWYVVPDSVELDDAFPEVADRSRVIHWSDFPKLVEGATTTRMMEGVYPVNPERPAS